MKLPFGTTNTVVEFNIRDISDIILVCQTAGVKSLELGPIKVTFQGQRGNVDVESEPEVVKSLTSEKPVAELTKVDKAMLRDAWVNQLMIDDPAAYERLIIDDSTRDGYVNGENDR